MFKLPPVFKSAHKRLSLLLFALVPLTVAAQHQATANAEMRRLKARALRTLAADIDEFNAYTNRPASDGPFNASNNKAFLTENVPLFEGSDPQLNKVYNYRWWMISKHLKQYDDPADKRPYWVVTEFFGVKPWASLSGAITCPAGHQFYDVRWLRDEKFLKSYAEYFMSGSASRLNQRENDNFLTYLSRPESHHFSSWMVDGVAAFLKVHPDRPWMRKLLPHLEKHQRVWDSLFRVQKPGARTDGLYKILDLYDGMEFSLSAVLGLIASDGAYSLYTKDNWRNYYLGWETTGRAAQSEQARQYPMAYRKGYPDLYLARPSVNGYAYGNLQALATLYGLAGADNRPLDAGKSAAYASRAAALQQKTLQVLWNDSDRFFNSRVAADNRFAKGDYEARVRESVGYTPWYFNMIPPESAARYAEAWKMFGAETGFNNTAGMTTAERQHPYYNEQAYAWNGRGWPFQNSVVYKAFANYLRNYKKNSTPADRELLYTYISKLAQMHGKKELNIGEWYIPSNGETFGGEKDYFHSTFPDIIIEDLLGFKPEHEDRFSIQPLLPEGRWDHFYLGNIRYHGHDIDVVWKKDWDAAAPGNQSALHIWVDQKLKASSKSLNGKLIVHL